MTKKRFEVNLYEVLKVQSSKERKTFRGRNEVSSVAFAKQKILSSIAQSVEHAAVNRAVVGSSPTRGVKSYLAVETK